MAVPSKKGRIPPVVGLHPQSRTKVELFYSDDDGLSVGAATGEDESRWIASLLSRERGSLYIPAPDAPDCDSVTSRFVGKIGLEILAHRLLDVSGWNDELVGKIEFDELRRYVRIGIPNVVWPVSVRRIYPPDFAFAEPGGPSYQTLHEFSVLITPASEYYAVIAIFGVEYAINLGGPKLNGFNEWLERNGNHSPLYR